MKTFGMITVLIAAILVGGCASSKSGEVYSRDEARQLMTVQLGTVEFVKPVRMEGSQSGLGAAAGGVAGGVVGSTIGGGKGSRLAALGGAAIGALAGNLTEKKMSELDGLEITVRLEKGDVLAVVQEDDVMFSVGDRVRVITSRDGTTRVEK